MEPFVPPLTIAELPPCGGRIGPDPEDFRVDEVAAYPLTGDGEHLFVQLEKRGWNTRDAVNALARAASVRAADLGVAGMKDRHAVTSQWVSLPARGVTPPESWSLPEGLRILGVTLHRNKLRTGHLSGNRFSIRLVDVDADAATRAQSILERLADDGMVNYFGAQRFGRDGTNLGGALAWLRRPRGKGRDRFERKLFPSVLQAEVFNRYASERAALGTGTALCGDVVRLAGSSSVFVVDDPDDATARLQARDVFLTGPIFGPKMKSPSGAPAEVERAALGTLGLTEAELGNLARLAPGTRRDLLVFPSDVGVSTADSGLRVSFSLPAGSYATEVLRQLTHAPFVEAGRGAR